MLEGSGCHFSQEAIMQRIPFIQVGVGNRGGQILHDFTTQGGAHFEPVDLVDLNPAFLAEASARPGLGHLPTYPTLIAALAQQPQAEAVVIVTPARFHTAMVTEALNAGKHVWVEKPLSYDYSEAVGMAELARRQRRVVVIGNQYQYHPLERRLRKLIKSQVYGSPFLVSYIHHRYRPDMRAFTGDYPALWDQGVHSLNSILAILGNPDLQSVYALGLRPPHSAYNSDTVTNLLTAFAGGAQAHLLVTFDSQRTDWEIRVECERAALLLKCVGWERHAIEVLQAEKVVEVLRVDEDKENAEKEAGDLVDPYSAFYAAITTGQTTPTSIDINLKTIQWIDAAVRSLKSGSVITF
jgi:predicted dehydrogenase